MNKHGILEEHLLSLDNLVSERSGGNIPHLIHSRNQTRKLTALGVRLVGEPFRGSIPQLIG
jgi:hypothetical protein